MGKRHQASRRKSYGRRQHEVRERLDRQSADRVPLTWDEPAAGSVVDPFAFLDPRAPRVRFAAGD